MSRNPDNLMWCVSVVLVSNEGHVLGVSRKNDHTFTQYGLPGGKCDPEDGEPGTEEALRAAAVRELFEETGVKVPPGDLVLLWEGTCEDKNNDDPDTWTVCYAAIGWRHVFPKQQPGEGKVAWVEWDELFRGPFREYNRAVYDAVQGKGGFELFFPDPRFRKQQDIDRLNRW